MDKSITEKDWYLPFVSATIYAIVCIFYIVISDIIVQNIYDDPFELTRAQTLKGWGFIVVTSVLIFFIIYFWSKKTRESEEKFKTLAETSPFAIFLYMDKFVYVNPSSERLTGYSSDELLTMNFWEVVHPDHREMVKKRGKQRVKGAKVQPTYEFKIVKKNGEPRWILFTGGSISFEGKLAGLGTAIDITERKKALQELQEHRESLEEMVEERTKELESANKELEAFAYSISHDLKAPLRAMEGFSNILVKDYSDVLDEKGIEYAERIKNASQKMDKLINDLLAYSRLSREEIALQRTEIEPALDKATKNLKTEIDEKDAEIEVYRNLGSAKAYEPILVQVLGNLLSNAIKFVEDGQRPKIRIWTEKTDGKIRIMIKDEGIGISPEYHDRIFDVFERLHGEEMYPGTGIGLGIVKKGIEKMNGTVGVESEVGEGSTFWIELDAA
ncbi:MAG: PAS domain S-box protein [Thermoplasmata archaeon]